MGDAPEGATTAMERRRPDDNEDGSERRRSSTVNPKSKRPQLVSFNRKNYLLHFYYIRRDFNACKALIKESLDECNELCDYPMYVRGKIAQVEGELDKALFWFESAIGLNPNNAAYLCRIGRIHFLLGSHQKAAEMLQRSIEKDPSSTQTYYWRAMSLFYTNRSDETIQMAQECLSSVPNIAQSPEILKFMADLFKKQNNLNSAVQAYEQLIKLEPDNVDALTNLGLIYFKQNNENNAFDMFGRALSYDPTDGNAIIAAGSIIQANGDYDVALSKYRVAAERCDYNGSLWNNIGMCFFGKGKYVAAISCLKKAYYLCPLDWKISYNLGLVHNSIKQYASAYHFFSAAVNLNPTFAMAYAALAAVLSNLNDPTNARKAYEKAVQLNNRNPQILINYAFFEAKQKRFDRVTELMKKCEECIQRNSPGIKDVLTGLENLKRFLIQVSKSEPRNDESYV